MLSEYAEFLVVESDYAGLIAVLQQVEGHNNSSADELWLLEFSNALVNIQIEKHVEEAFRTARNWHGMLASSHADSGQLDETQVSHCDSL